MSRDRETKRKPRQTARMDEPEPVDVQVGLRLRQARLVRGLTQTELSEAIGVSFQAVQKYETADNRLSASRMFRASQVLGVPVATLFQDVQSDAHARADGHFSKDELALIRAIRGIGNGDVREAIAQLIKYLPMASRRGK